MKIKSHLVKSLSLVILLVAISIVGFHLNKAPRLVTTDAPLTEFSAARAMNHLEHVAFEPHYIGTKGNTEVCNYIIEELKKMGIEPEIQTAEMYDPGSFWAATVKNIIVRLPGTENSKSVLIMGHYDSARDSYGASDDGSAVVTMLETIRILLLKQPSKNDIIFLFTDGEEIASIGAKAFLEKHPLAKNIGLVLNFESSGTRGPSMMFETSADNNWIISEFAKAVHYPIAHSLLYEIYCNMPNDTDLTPFKNEGIKGFNFAYLENRFDYHTGGDNVKNTSAESIQHHGLYAVPLTEHFANIDLNNNEKGNAVYFNTIGKGFAHYSYKWIIPFVSLTLLTLFGILFIGYKRKLIRPLHLLFGFFDFVIHLIIAPAIVTLIYFILIKYYPGNDFHYDFRLLFYNQDILLLGFACIAVAISFLFCKSVLKGIRLWHLIPLVAVVIVLLIWSGQISLITVLATVAVATIIYFLNQKPVNVWELSFGSFIGWAILMVVTGFMMPGISYLFTWPLLFSLIPVGIYFLRKNQDEYSTLQIGLFLFAALPALVWLTNLTYLFFSAMGLQMVGGAILFTVLCLSLLVIHIDIITRVKPWIVPSISLFAGLFFLLYGSVNLKYDERYRKQNSLIFVSDGNTNKSFFTSLDDKPDEWTVDYLTVQPNTVSTDDFIFFGKRNFIVNPAEAENLPAPTLLVMNDSIIGNQRLLKLHINSGRKANNLFIQIKSKSDSVKASVNESAMKDLNLYNNSDRYLLRYFALPEEGIELEILLENRDVELYLTDFIYGLPAPAGIEIKPRPDYMMSDGDMTIATKKFVIKHF